MNPARTLRRAVRSALIARGYDIVRPTYGVHDDPLAAQQALLGEVEAPVILDVGANLGQSAVAYRRRFPNARIYSFEPLPESFAALAAVAAENPGVEAVQAAVVATSGSTRLHSNQRSSTNSVFATAAEAGEYVDASLMREVDVVEVPSTSIDDFCAGRAIDRVAILKLDIQGAEVLALRGAERMLGEARIALIYTEALFAPLYEGQADFWSQSEVLRGHGYRLYGLFDLNYGRNGMLAWADALWVAPGYAPISVTGPASKG